MKIRITHDLGQVNYQDLCLALKLVSEAKGFSTIIITSK